MKSLFLLILCSVFSFQVNAKSENGNFEPIADSLALVINNTTEKDSSLVLLYLDLVAKIYLYNPDSAVYYGKLANVLSTDLNYNDGIAESCGWLGYLELNRNDDDVAAMKYNIQAISALEEIGDFSGKARVLNSIGMINDSRSNFDLALENFNEALELATIINDVETVTLSLNNIGYVYLDQGNIPKALESLNKSLAIAELIDDKMKINMALNNLAFLYQGQDNNEEALKLFLRSLEITKALNDQYSLCVRYSNIGILYRKMGNIKEAEKYIDLAYTTSIKLGDKEQTAYALSSLGSLQEHKGEIDEALKFFQEALVIREEINDDRGLCDSYLNIGNIMFLKGNNEQALYYTQKSFKLSEQIGIQRKISDASLLLSDIYFKNGQGQNAYLMYKKGIATRDSLTNESNQKLAIQQQIKYEYDKKRVVDEAENNKLLAVEKEAKEKQEIVTKFAAIGLILVVTFLVFIFHRLKVTKQQKLIIENQKEEVEFKNVLIEESHKEITDSIAYAKRLQEAILPSFEEVNSHLHENFILFEPKNVVSGDFYWFETKTVLNRKINLFAAADCTGHGVPGAMVSVVCSNALNRTVNEFGIIEPAKILDKTRELVINTFAKNGDKVKDGMDIALCAFSEDNLTYSGANNPLWIVRNTNRLTQTQLDHKSTITIEDLSLIEFKANRQPVGLYEGMSPFNEVSIELFKGDMVYFFTDGFADQFGGIKGKKYKYKQFKQLLINQSQRPLEEQKTNLKNELLNWKGDLEQVDDVCIIGVRS